MIHMDLYVFGMSGLVFLMSDLVFGCLDFYLGCLDLYFECLDLYLVVWTGNLGVGLVFWVSGRIVFNIIHYKLMIL